MKRLVVVGQGYVGLPLTMRAVEAGHTVIGIDVDPLKVAALQDGSSYIGDVSDEQLNAALRSDRYRPSATYDAAENFDVAVITVPTPLKDSLPDISYIETAVSQLAPHLTRGALVVLESTTYPGTTQDVVAPMLEQLSGLRAGTDFKVGYSPERIDPGNPTWGFENTPKVVSGIDAESCAAVDEFYSGLVDVTVVVPTPREAELAKLLENTFRHVNIALVNEIAMFAQQLDIDIWSAIDAAATKPFGFMKFTPGPGVGGHCLPVDPSYLSWQVRQKLGRASRFIELANDVNEHMPDYVVQRLMEGLNRHGKAVRGSKVLLLGLAYKRNTADIRESPALRVVELLKYLGADLTVVDPVIDPAAAPHGVTHEAQLTELLVTDADAIVIVTAHDAFDYEMVERLGAYVFDAQRVTSGSTAELL